MELLLLLPSLLIFLYSLYRLVKDDYVFIRKGISLEQSFDIAFSTIWISLILSRVVYLLNVTTNIKYIFLHFFSISIGGFSFIGGILGGLLSLYFISKSKRISLGRLIDFFSISLLFATPVGLLMNTIFAKKNELLVLFLDVVIYFILLIFFIQFLYPKLMNRTLKEGTLAKIFLICFSCISTGQILLSSLSSLQKVLNVDFFLAIILLIISIALFIRRDNTSSSQRRSFLK